MSLGGGSGGKHTSINAGNSNQLFNDNTENEADDQDLRFHDDNQQLQNAHQQQYLQNQQHQRNQPQYQQQQYSYPPNSYAGNGANHRDEPNRRYRREVFDANDPLLDAELKKRGFCQSTQCAAIKCTASNLIGNHGASVAFRLRLVSQTVNLVSCVKMCLLFSCVGITFRCFNII